MRQTVVETTDGKDIMVPNTKFIEDAYENWTHKDPRQRYEVHFTVGFDTDLDSLEDLIIPAFLEHPSVLKEPEMPDLEFREFGEYGAKMAVEFWCSGIDDGPNKFTSDLNFIVWRLLRDQNISRYRSRRWLFIRSSFVGVSYMGNFASRYEFERLTENEIAPSIEVLLSNFHVLQEEYYEPMEGVDCVFGYTEMSNVSLLAAAAVKQGCLSLCEYQVDRKEAKTSGKSGGSESNNKSGRADMYLCDPYDNEWAYRSETYR